MKYAIENGSPEQLLAAVKIVHVHVIRSFYCSYDRKAYTFQLLKVINLGYGTFKP